MIEWCTDWSREGDNAMTACLIVRTLLNEHAEKDTLYALKMLTEGTKLGVVDCLCWMEKSP